MKQNRVHSCFYNIYQVNIKGKKKRPGKGKNPQGKILSKNIKYNIAHIPINM